METTKPVETKKAELTPAQQELKMAVVQYLGSLNNNLTDNEKKMFWGLCKLYNLNPLKREAYAVKYGNQPFQTITGYEVYVKRAEATGLLDYWEVTSNFNENNQLVSATFIGKRKDQSREFKKTILLSEFSTGQSTWKTKPSFMLEKCATGIGFRLLFPNELAGAPYLQEEMEFMKPQAPKIERID